MVTVLPGATANWTVSIITLIRPLVSNTGHAEDNFYLHRSARILLRNRHNLGRVDTCLRLRRGGEAAQSTLLRLLLPAPT
jgi:hypothetical protein